MDDASGASASPVAPAQLITSTDKRGLVAVIAIVFASFVVSAFLTRLYIRLRVSGPWRHDDNIVAAATVLSVAHAAVLRVAVKYGFGLTVAEVEPRGLPLMGKFVYSSDVLYLIAMLLSKAATIMLFLRLSPSRPRALVAYVVLGLSVVWALVSIPVITVHFYPQAWNGSSDVGSEMFGRWVFVAVVDILTEAMIFCMSIALVWRLKMAVLVKLTVVAAFGMRLPVIVAAALRLYYKKVELDSSDLTLSAANTAVWTVVELSYAVISCTLLCLGPFITPFEKTHHANKGQRPSYKLSALSRSTQDDSRVRQSAFIAPNLRPDGYSFRTDIAANPPNQARNDTQRRVSMGSNESRRMIINKQVEVVTTIETPDSASAISDGGPLREARQTHLVA